MIDEHDRNHNLQPLFGADLIFVLAAPFDVVAGGIVTRCATTRLASSTNPPTSRPRTFISTVPRSSPFSLVIIDGPIAIRISAICFRGICVPFGAGDQNVPQLLRCLRENLARSARARETAAGLRS